ncbi:MAG: hypothetical protein AAGC74_07455 [Verrucomicrobiota bacterium]
MPKLYESSAVVELIVPDDLGPGNTRQEYLSTQAEIFISHRNFERVAKRVELRERWGRDMPSVIEALEAMVQVEFREGTSLLGVSVRQTHPRDAREIAGALLRAYQEIVDERYQGEMQERIEVLRSEVYRVEDEVEKALKVFDKVRQIREETASEEFTEEGEIGSSYEEARLNYETKRDFHRELERDLAREEVAAKLPQNVMVVHERPEEGKSPVSPQVERNLSLGFLSGGLFGLLLAWPTMLGFSAISAKRGQQKKVKKKVELPDY